ncbi:MAG: hypothetical protein LBU43_09525 [Candidatus Accumulibacter sp.]|jgi:hypothetical protein|nr:hypothetical protein [Accumulibacter sp.]
MPPACLTLLVSELLWPDPDDREALDLLVCPALAALLARGRFSKRRPQALETVLLEAFGHAAEASRGALRLLGESAVPADAATARWIAADPVHLRLEQRHLILAGGDTLDIAPDEAAALIDALNRYFTDLGVFHAASAERWYLRLAGKNPLQDIDAPPLSAVAGRGVGRVLEEITENREILKILNEIQTFLHAHPVNRRRADKGLASINSLWLWGAGIWPTAPVTPPFDSVWSKEPLTRGLACAARIPASPVPDDAGALLAAAPGARALAVLDELTTTVHYANGTDYRQALAALETHWFAPAWRALTSGAIKRLRLVATTAYGTLRWDAGRADSWRFWRSPRTLMETVQTLAASTGDTA